MIAPKDSGSSVSPSPKKAHIFLFSFFNKPRLIKYFVNLAWYIDKIGPSPIDTVGNCQNFGINHGWGYDESPSTSTSCLKFPNCFAVSLPSKKALAYIPGALWPWK